eukprot:scaffold1173_cov405-Prasinococcus_capsulatus_cf.AAC.23
MHTVLRVSGKRAAGSWRRLVQSGKLQISWRPSSQLSTPIWCCPCEAKDPLCDHGVVGHLTRTAWVLLVAGRGLVMATRHVPRRMVAQSYISRHHSPALHTF